MSWLYRTITAHDSIAHAQTRKLGEEVKEAIRRLEDIQEQLNLALNHAGTTVNVISNSTGTPQKEGTYPLIINPGDVMPHVGKRLSRTKAVKIRWCELIFDPAIVASAATVFTLQNAASSPTSSGTITVAAGASSAESSSLAVTIGVGQRMFLKAPSALNDLQGLYSFDVEFDIL